MSETFDKLKAKLEADKKLSNEDIESAVKEHGDLTDDERVWLESERYKLEREQDQTITMDQYLEALKVLDNSEEGSDEYKNAEALVEKYEAGG